MITYNFSDGFKPLVFPLFWQECKIFYVWKRLEYKFYKYKKKLKKDWRKASLTGSPIPSHVVGTKPEDRRISSHSVVYKGDIDYLDPYPCVLCWHERSLLLSQSVVKILLCFYWLPCSILTVIKNAGAGHYPAACVMVHCLETRPWDNLNIVTF